MNEGAGNPAPFLRLWIGANAFLCGIMLAEGFPMHELRKISYYERLLTLDMPASAHFIYNHAGTMNQRGGGDTMYTSFNAYNSEVVADDVVVVGDAATSKYVLVGALTANRSLTHLSVVWRGRKMREIKIWQPEIKEGEEPEEIAILEGDDWRDLLIRYGAMVSEKMHALSPAPDAKNVTGYCSWYYYYKDVTEKDFLENVETLATHQSSPFKARYVQIDDGYQAFQGDWNDQHASWPTPLADIAKKITDAGMEAGIWTMPFHASTASRVFREHPDWFVKGADGKPLVAKGWSPPPDHLWATLDTTQDAVLEHLSSGPRRCSVNGVGAVLAPGERKTISCPARIPEGKAPFLDPGFPEEPVIEMKDTSTPY